MEMHHFSGPAHKIGNYLHVFSYSIVLFPMCTNCLVAYFQTCLFDSNSSFQVVTQDFKLIIGVFILW